MRKGCGSACCDKMSLDGGGALVRDAAESRRFRPMIEWTLLGLTTVTLPRGKRVTKRLAPCVFFPIARQDLIPSLGLICIPVTDERYKACKAKLYLGISRNHERLASTSHLACSRRLVRSVNSDMHVLPYLRTFLCFEDDLMLSTRERFVRVARYLGVAGLGNLKHPPWETLLIHLSPIPS
jgi:hypothetical protein